MEIQEKKGTERLKDTENLFRNKLQIKDVCANSRLKFFQIKGQRKAFYGQRISEPSLRRSKLLIRILVTSGNGDRKIKQSIRMASRPSQRIRKLNQLSLYQSITYRKDLSWPHSADEAVSEGATVLNIHLCSLSNIFKQHLGTSGQT